MKTTVSHTPGPWLHEAGHIVARKPNGDVARKNSIAKVFPESWPLNSETEANARLIAAAPELLEALLDLLGQCDQGCHFHDVVIDSPSAQEAMRKAQAAIARATQPEA